MTPAHESLLIPSLGHGRLRAMHPLPMLFLMALIGGGASVWLISALNSHRLGRLTRDSVWLLVALLLCLAVLWATWSYTVAVGSDSREAMRDLRWLFALGLCGTLYLLHRPHYVAESSGYVESQYSLWAGTAAVLFGWALNAAAVVWVGWDPLTVPADTAPAEALQADGVRV